MDLIKSFIATQIAEDAAVGAVSAGDISVAPMPLFTSMVKRPLSASKPKTKAKGKGSKTSLQEMINSLTEDDATSASPNTPTPSDDTTGIIAKLKALETKERTDYRNVTVFGLEDSDGGTVRVSVSNEQAAEFEKALQTIRSEEDDMEIPEVLFNLKDKFDILNVEWPEIEEDEEEIQTISPQPGAGAEHPEAGSDDLSSELNVDANQPPDAGLDANKGQTQDLLTQVIDMMKADAEARKAEAEAKKAEARSRESELALQQTNNKVKQEEQMLDMESYEKSQKEASRETKRLAKLARWKQGVDREDGDSNDETDHDLQSMGLGADSEENEEQSSKSSIVRKKVQPIDIANFILKRVRQ